VHSESATNAYWYAIYTKPREEERADSNLRAWGVETFSPKLKEKCRRRYSNQVTYTIKPLFSRYIFAKFDASVLLQKIYYTRGVHSVVCYADQPAIIDGDIIDEIKTRVRDDGFIELEDTDDFKQGDKVVIQDGSLSGISGVFHRGLKDSERVLILLTNVKYQVSVAIDRGRVTRAGEARRVA
jgi:transcriptional antiterminator RfaH